MTLFLFEDCEADDVKFELRRLGQTVRVQRIVLETLFYFLRSGGRLISKRDLGMGPWKGLRVSDAALSRGVMLARRAVNDDRGRIIRTVHGSGYRLTCNVLEVQAGEARPAEPVSESGFMLQAGALLRPEQLAEPHEPFPSVPSLDRARELAALHSAFGAAQAGHGRIVIVTGAARSGKTALLERFACELKQGGASAVWGRSWKASSAPLLWIWLEVVRACLSGLDAGEPPASPRLQWTSLRARLEPSSEGELELKSSNDQFHIYDAVTRLLRDVARKRALAVLLEDVHDTDEGSLLLLEFLRQRIGEIPLLVVATLRPLARGADATFPLMTRGAHVVLLPLSSNGDSSVARAPSVA